MFSRAVLVAGLTTLAAVSQTLALPLDKPGSGGTAVTVVGDGSVGGAARFADPRARIDAGPLAVSSHESFSLRGALRTTSAGFSTALIARAGEDVGLAVVMGRSPGKLSFE